MFWAWQYHPWQEKFSDSGGVQTYVPAHVCHLQDTNWWVCLVPLQACWLQETWQTMNGSLDVARHVSYEVYDIQCLANGPERWVHMNSLKKYHDKPLHGWLVPGHHNWVYILWYSAFKRTCLLSEKAEISNLTRCSCGSTGIAVQPRQEKG